ncbi:AMP-binding protein [Sphingomonas solaris]|uniref:AMP-binding protein n=2 Tax=Alterirhizorhabdus solaris TaxID=2529389 RepID=A0A558R0H8_9SPHN|nr:AMP-binding protein [Sphingomonas solaris]
MPDAPDPAQANIVAHFLARAGVRGDRPFLVHAGGTLRYDALDRETGRLARRLLDLGAAAGDRIVVQVEKSPHAVLLYLAAVRAGLVFVPLNTAYGAGELGYFIGDAEPAIVVCRPQDGAAVAGIAGAAAVRTLGADGTGTLLDGMGDDTAPVAERAADDVACILYTSGTTGRSKGAMLTHGNLLSNALTLHDLWRWAADDVLLHILPIYHVHGLFVALHGALVAGATVLFHAGFDPDAAIAALGRATVMMGVPTHYTRLLGNPGLTREACAGVRLFVSGSAPLLAQTHDRFAAVTGHRILERYGMTETGMIASNPYDGARVAGAVGYALPGVEVRVPGSPAVLEVRGPNVLKGYWRNPEKTAEAFTADGWFITGDLAEMSADGRITLVGREKDLIIAGGLNIYPSEIEDVIDALPGVTESAVIGVPHADLGEAVVAVVVADAGVTPEGVIAALDGRLARFKQPRHVTLVAELPRNAMGKVQKARLRADYAGLFAPAG